MTFLEKQMRVVAWALVLMMVFPLAGRAAVDQAATSKDKGVEPDASEPAMMAKDYLRAATPEVSALSRLVLSQAVGALSQPGMPFHNVTEAQWLPIRDRAVRDGAADPLVQAVFLIGSRQASGSAALRNHAIDMLTGRVAQNGQFGLILLSLPDVAGDPSVERDILHQAARATGYSSPYTVTHRALLTDLADFHWTQPVGAAATLPPVSDEMLTEIVASSLSVLAALPQLGPVFKLCKDATTSVRDDCQQLGQRLFVHAETAIDLTSSLRLIEMTAPNDDVRAQVTNERRRFAWQIDQYSTIFAGGKFDTPVIRRHLESQRQLTEIEALHQTLVEQNLPLEPPVAWRSASEKFSESQPNSAKKTSP